MLVETHSEATPGVWGSRSIRWLKATEIQAKLFFLVQLFVGLLLPQPLLPGSAPLLDCPEIKALFWVSDSVNPRGPARRHRSLPAVPPEDRLFTTEGEARRRGTLAHIQ